MQIITKIRLLQLSLILFSAFFYSVSSHSEEKTSTAVDYQWLTDYVSLFNKESGFSGSILISKGTDTLFNKAIGWENVEQNKRISADTKFNLGSGNKMFTAVAIAQLVEAGKLNFNDPINNYLTNYPDKSFAQNATVHHLLSHRSGLGDFWDDEFEKYWHKVDDLKDHLPFVIDKERVFKPGESYQYSNSGYILLGLIIEKVSGQNYFDYVQKNIYQPAGMNDSGTFDINGNTKNLAIGYDGKNTDWYRVRHNL